jgi:hypothetical protein
MQLTSLEERRHVMSRAHWLACFGILVVSPLAGQDKQLHNTLGAHADAVGSVTFSPDGKTIASASSDKRIKLWNVASGENTATLDGHTDRVSSICYSPDGKMIISGSRDKTLKLWDIIGGRPPVTLRGHTGFVTCVACAPDGKTLVSGSTDKTIRIWNRTNGRNTGTLNGHGDDVYSVVCSSDGKTLASASREATIRLWDLASGRKLAELEGAIEPVFCMALRRNNRSLAAGSGDGSLTVWDVSTRKIVSTLDGHAGAVACVAFSADGKTLASGGSDRTIKLWDTASGKRIATLRGHTKAVYCVAFSPDGQKLVSGSQDGTIRLWNTLELGQYHQDRDDREDAILRPARGAKIEARFTAKVKWTDMVGKRDTEAVPIGVLPRWLAEVEILSIERAAKPFDKKGSIVLAIHSPVLVFAEPAEAIPGQQYSFVVFGRLRDGNPEYYTVEARRVGKEEGKKEKEERKATPRFRARLSRHSVLRVRRAGWGVWFGNEPAGEKRGHSTFPVFWECSTNYGKMGE